MVFREAVEHARASKRLMLKPLPPIPQVAKTAAALAERLTRFAEPAAFDLDALRAKLTDVAASGDWKPVTERELRYVGFCLWEANSKLADDLPFLEKYFDALRGASSRIATKLLLRTYFSHFNAVSPGLRVIARYLREAVGRWEWSWAALQREYAVFTPDEGPRLLAMAALGSGNPRAFLEGLGFKGQLATNPFVAACFRAAAESVGKTIVHNSSVAKARLVTDWALEADGRVRFSAERGTLANSLLLPWSQSDPADELRSHLSNFFLSALGDPRISPLTWSQADDRARDVMFRWLAQASLEQFLRVVDKTASGHQWEYRRAFWSAYIDPGYVRDAWVAFGPVGQEYAARLAEATGDKSMARFGRLDRAYDGAQAVLLLRIGDLIIGDWSHNGTLRIWRVGNPSAPSFYKLRYEAPELRKGSDFDRVHSHPPGAWQRDAADFIRRHTRINLKENDYMPQKRTQR